MCVCVCVSEFSLIVISSDRDLISRCSMSFDFWLFVCRLILEIFEVCAFRGSFLCFSSLTWVVLSYLALAVELGLSVCAVEEVDLIARQLRFRAWRSDFEVLGFLLGGCQRKEW